MKGETKGGEAQNNSNFELISSGSLASESSAVHTVGD